MWSNCLKAITIAGACLMLIACSNKRLYAEDNLNREYSNVTAYLNEVYPGESFSVSIAKEYVHDTYSYTNTSGYIITRKVIDSKGNVFSIYKHIDSNNFGGIRSFYNDDREKR